MLLIASASSTGGLTALALKKLCWKSKGNHQTDETGGEQKKSKQCGIQVCG
jgi:hypothetical protein